MKLYSRYIFNKTLLSFVGFSSILILLIWFSRAISFVKYITENGIALSQFFYLFVLILPWLFLFIIPISLFGAILMIYNKLISSNEITILKNSGLTKFAISKPVISLAIFSSLICFVISIYLMPYANKKFRASRVNFTNNYANLSINPQTFETLKNLTIYIKDRDKENNLSGILLFEDKPGEYNLTITAKSGHIVSEDNSALLYMDTGTIQKFNKKDKSSEILNFESYVFNLTNNQGTQNKRRWKAKERYLDELLHPNDDSTKKDIAKYRSEFHQRLTYPLLPICFAIIALTCILRDNYSRRGNLSNIILATSMGTIFLVLTIMSYDLIETSAQYAFAPYLNIVLFPIICLFFTNRNSYV